MKLACVLIPHFPLQIESKYHHIPKNQPVLIVKSAGSQRIIVDASPHLLRIHPGMSLQTALSQTSDAHLIEDDDVLYSTQWNSVLDTLAERSPFIEDAGLGKAYINLAGIDSLYSTDAHLAHALQSAIPADLQARIGVGGNKFISYSAALVADSNRPFKAPHHPADLISRLPVDVLPMDFTHISKLHRYGLHTLSDITQCSLSALQAQLGSKGKRIWELAHGIDNSPLNLRCPEDNVSGTITFLEPLGTLESIVIGVEILLERVFANPNLHGRDARVIDIEAQIYKRGTWVTRCSFKSPVGKPKHAISRISSVLKDANLSGPIEELTLSLRSLTKETAYQSSLFSDTRKRENLTEAIRQLDASLGEQAPIFYVRGIEPWSRIPERRHTLVSVAR